MAESLRKAEELTKDYGQGIRLNVCLCYNSRNEILDAFEATASSEKVSLADFESHLYGGFNCKPDILIRTSNEIRLSNFLLYQTDASQY